MNFGAYIHAEKEEILKPAINNISWFPTPSHTDCVHLKKDKRSPENIIPKSFWFCQANNQFLQ